MPYKDPEKRRRRCRERYWENREQAKKRRKEYYWANPEKFREDTRRWARENPERAAKNTQRWAQDNADRVRRNARRYYDANSEKIKERSAKRYYDNREDCLVKSRDRKLSARLATVCQVTGNINVPKLPGAPATTTLVDRCHIKPRRYCDKDEAKDKNNILHLDVRLHRLFDSLRIAVAPNGTIMVDKGLPDELAEKWAGRKVNGYTPENDRYMSFHRRLCYYGGFDETVPVGDRATPP